MKHSLKFFVIIIILSLFFTTISYSIDNVQYTLKDLDITVSIPSNLPVVTREVSEDDPDLKVFGLPREELIKNLINNNIYLSAYSPNELSEVVIKMTPISDDINFDLTDYINNINANELQEVINTLKSTYEDDYGMKKVQMFLYTHELGIKFFKIYFFNPATNENNILYYTYANKKYYYIILISYSEEITQTQNVLLENIVNSIKFINYKYTPYNNTASVANTATKEFFLIRPLQKALVGGASGLGLGATIIAIIRNKRKKKIIETSYASNSTSKINKIYLTNHLKNKKFKICAKKKILFAEKEQLRDNFDKIDLTKKKK